jgi:hypothetical protein
VDVAQLREQRAQRARQVQAEGGPGDWLAALGRRAGRALRSKHDGAILSLAGPALLALAADPLLSMVDTAFVGQIGPGELVSRGAGQWLPLLGGLSRLPELLLLQRPRAGWCASGAGRGWPPPPLGRPAAPPAASAPAAPGPLTLRPPRPPRPPSSARPRWA